MKTTDAKFKNQWAINTTQVTQPNSVEGGGAQVVSTYIRTPKDLIIDGVKEFVLQNPERAKKWYINLVSKSRARLGYGTMYNETNPNKIWEAVKSQISSKKQSRNLAEFAESIASLY